jgi:hypothetical protein
MPVRRFPMLPRDPPHSAQAKEQFRRTASEETRAAPHHSHYIYIHSTYLTTPLRTIRQPDASRTRSCVITDSLHLSPCSRTQQYWWREGEDCRAHRHRDCEPLRVHEPCSWLRCSRARDAVVRLLHIHEAINAKADGRVDIALGVSVCFRARGGVA